MPSITVGRRLERRHQADVLVIGRVPLMPLARLTRAVVASVAKVVSCPVRSVKIGEESLGGLGPPSPVRGGSFGLGFPCGSRLQHLARVGLRPLKLVRVMRPKCM